ncbi:MAG: InlB B-repeat-containing protein [Clostridiales Family XIII bacterium]|jgi:uncharacterized repeat protein (TIGR02543 family)|nr:InlB B-repeat-containing protein [Clostridiales Family XIII bacterium]
MIGDGVNFVDVDGIGNAYNWGRSAGNQQIQITALFSEQGLGKTRSIEVKIPRGLKIVEYSANSATGAISGVGKIDFSSTDDTKVATSVLTALDGGSWLSQRIGGYTGEVTSTVTPYRNYDGKVTYTFNTNCDRIVLTLTLGLDVLLLPYTNTTATLGDDIEVSMTSGATQLDDHLTTTVTGLTKKALSLNTLPANDLEGIVDTIDENTGQFPDFRTRIQFDGSGSIPSSRRQYAESRTVTIAYPLGITYEGFDSTTFTQSHPTEPNSDSYADGHLVVVHDDVARTITFTFSNFYNSYYENARLVLYWSGEVDNNNIKWGDTLNFPVTSTTLSGALIGDSQTATTTATEKCQILKPNVVANIKIVESNRTVSDLNADGLFPYDYALGAFNVRNFGPSIAEDLTYAYAFSPKLAVRALALPGKEENTYRDLIAHTSTGREIKMDGSLDLPRGMESSAFMIRAEYLGLASDEYLLDLTITQDSLYVSLNQNTAVGYTHHQGVYYGRFQGGESGSATLTITDKDGGLIVTSTDTPVIGWTNSSRMVGMSTSASHSPSASVGGSYYPNDKMYFSMSAPGGYTMAPTQDEIVDPTIYIALPAGIELEEDSIRVTSRAGNHGATAFAPTIAGSQTKVIDGVEWTCYEITTQHLDIIAQSYNMDAPGTNLTDGVVSRTFSVKFTANVASTCQAYPALSMKDIVLLDLGKTAAVHETADANNWAGKGTGYNLTVSDSTNNAAVVQKPGLNVSLGIRVLGDTGPYYTYNGTSASVAPVTPDLPAEVYLKYENTSTDAYYAGSEIYLPIPKKNQVYDHFFSNKEVADPYNANDTATPQWSSVLTGPISLSGFTTYYTTDTSGATNYTGGTVADTWVPYTPTAWTDDPTTFGSNFGLVTMVKFVATLGIPAVGDAGSTGSTTFVLDVDSSANLGELDYWRTYQKGWRLPGGEGSWVYGSVLAAEPSNAGVKGMVFDDKDLDGVMDTGEAFNAGSNPALTQMRGTLTSPTGTISLLNIVVNADGSFASLNSGGTPYYLKAGNYVLTIYNETSGTNTKGFTTTTSGTRSVNLGDNITPDYRWYMDIAQADVPASHASATYRFTVSSGTLQTQLVGVGLHDAALVTYTAGTGASFTPDVTEYRNHNQQPSAAVVPSFTALSNTAVGYNPATAVWTADKALTFTNAITLGDTTVVAAGTPVAAGIALTRAQVLLAKITEDVTFTASLSLNKYTVTYAGGGATSGTMDAVPNITHGTDHIIVANDFVKDGYTFDGWEATYTAATVNPAHGAGDPYSGGSYYAEGATITGLTASITLTAQWLQNFSDATIQVKKTAAVSGTANAATALNFAFTLTRVTAAGGSVAWSAAATATDPGPVSEHIATTSGVAAGGTTLDFPDITGLPMGIYYFEITEDAPGSAPIGWTFDTAKKHVTVTVSATGAVSYSEDYDGSGAIPTFNNTYTSYTVTYHNTAADALTAAVPVDSSSPYPATAEVVVLGPQAGGGNLARTNFTFAGWATSLSDVSSGTVTYADSAITGGTAKIAAISANTHLYPVWTRNTNKLSFVLNGTSIAPTAPASIADVAAYGAGLPISSAPGFTSAPTRTGYTFGGWYLDAGLGATAALSSAPNMPDADTTIYAKWSPILYRVNFTAANGGTLSGTTRYSNIEYATDWSAAVTSIPKPVPESGHYSFVGWTGPGMTKPVLAPVWPAAVTSNLTYTANFEADTHTVTYVGNEHTSGAVPGTTTHGHGTNATVKDPGDLARIGYTFFSWNTTPSGSGTSYAAGAKISKITADTTLYAQWTASYFTVSYEPGGANVTGVPGGATVQAETAYTVSPAIPARLGYTFTGWAASIGGVYSGGNTFTMPFANVTLTAQWTANYYSVSYAAGGTNVTGLPGGARVLPGTAYTISSQTPQREGYTFDGWSSSLSGAIVQSGGVFTMPRANVVLTAQWRTDSTVTPNPEVTTPSVGGDNGGDIGDGGGGTEEVIPEPAEPEAGVAALGLGDIPLGNFQNSNTWSLISLLFSIIAVIASILLIVAALVKRTGQKESRKKQGQALKVFAIIAGILTPVVWVILDDLSNPMAWVNRWTVFVGVVFIVHLALVLLYAARSRKDDDGDADDGSVFLSHDESFGKGAYRNPIAD